jgi:hypothetical protein
MSAQQGHFPEKDTYDEELVEDLEAPVSIQAKVEGGLPFQWGSCGGYLAADGGTADGLGQAYDTKSHD